MAVGVRGRRGRWGMGIRVLWGTDGIRMGADLVFPQNTGHWLLRSETSYSKTMGKSRPTYSEEFRRDAVELLRTSGKPLSHVSRELGISEASLRKWKEDLYGVSGGLGSGAARVSSDVGVHLRVGPSCGGLDARLRDGRTVFDG